MKITQMSIDRWMNGNRNVIYTCNAILFSLKKKNKEILPFSITCLKSEDIMLSETNTSHRKTDIA